MAGEIIRLSLNTERVDRAVSKLLQAQHVAQVRALKRAATTTRAFMATAIAADMAVKVGAARAAMQIRQDRVESEHVITVQIAGARLPLVQWVRNPQPSRRRKGGVTARLPGGAGRYPRAFVAQMASGHVGVFERKGKARLPIAELFGPSMVKAFRTHREAGRAAGQAALTKNLQHEFRWALEQSSQAA